MENTLERYRKGPDLAESSSDGRAVEVSMFESNVLLTSYSDLDCHPGSFFLWFLGVGQEHRHQAEINLLKSEITRLRVAHA